MFIIVPVLFVFSYAIKIICPEESFTIVASTPQEKVCLWFMHLPIAALLLLIWVLFS